MAANQGAIGKTVVLAIAVGTASTNVGNITSVSFPGVSVDTIDITSTDGGTDAPTYKSFIAGLADGGEIEVEMVYAAADAAFILSQIGASDRKFTITLPATSNGEGATAGTASFSTYGLISAHGGAIPMEDKISENFTIKCSGGPTFATS